MKKRGAGLNSPSSILLLTLEPECQQSFLFFPETFFLNEKFFSDQMSFQVRVNTLSVNGQIVNIVNFASHKASVATAQTLPL